MGDWQHRAWRIIEPPFGCHIRRYVAYSLIAFGLVRLLNLPAAGNVALSWLPFEAYGGLKIVLGLLLLFTNRKRRLTWYGYPVAWLALAFCAMAAADSWPLANGVAVYLLLCWALLGESVSRHECL